MQAITVIPMQAGVPVSSPGRRLTIDAGAVNRELVLDDGGILGTVNANLRHDQAAATALAKTDQPWLGRLITWRSPRPLAGGPATAARRRIAASRKTGWRLAVMTPRRCRTILGTVPRCATERGHEIHGDHGLPTDNRVAVRPGDSSTADEVESWLRDYACGHDPYLRERIILAYLGLADRRARRYRGSRGTTLDDLTQTARTGLIAAVDRYQPGRRGGFVPFAVASVVGELKRSLRDTSWRVHVPRPLKERTVQLCRAADELQQALGRSPTAVELADHLHVTVDEVLKELGVAMSRREISLDQPLGEDGDDCLGDRLATPGPREEPEDLLALAGLIAELPGLERTVIVLRFFENLDQSTIAARIGYSQMQVSRLERRALARMRTQLLEP